MKFSLMVFDKLLTKLKFETSEKLSPCEEQEFQIL